MEYAEIELVYELDYNDEDDRADLEDAWFAPTEADLIAHSGLAAPARAYLPVAVIVASAFVVAAVGAAVF